LIAEVAELAKSVWLETGSILGVGLIVIKKETSSPTHPFIVGVTLIVEVIGPVVALIALNKGISPLPEVANPIAAFELVHV
jgi:hypothetical protein